MGDNSEEKGEGFTRMSGLLSNAVKDSTMKMWFGDCTWNLIISPKNISFYYPKLQILSAAKWRYVLYNNFDQTPASYRAFRLLYKVAFYTHFLLVNWIFLETKSKTNIWHYCFIMTVTARLWLWLCDASLTKSLVAQWRAFQVSSCVITERLRLLHVLKLWNS